MRNRVLIGLLISLLNTCPVLSQEWSAPCFFSSIVLDVEPASDGSALYFAGIFNQIDNTTNVYSVARYDGSVFTTINQTILDPTPAYEVPEDINLKSFGDRLYFEGNANNEAPVIQQMEGDTVNNNYLLFENGSWHQWDIAWMNDPENTWNNRTACIEVIDDELWVISLKRYAEDPFRWARVQLDGSIDHYEIASTENEVVGEIQGTIGEIIKWNDDYYLAGRFYKVNAEGTGSTQVHIIKWDGSNNFEYLPQAFFGGLFTSVSELTVFNDKLVVAGNFSVSQSGSPSNYIMTWDGSDWAPLFGAGTNGPVVEMKVIDDKLFFSGGFSQLFREDGVYAASRIAYYDGEQAYRLSDQVIDWSIIDFELFQDQLYVVGNIETIQLQDFGYIARFEGDFPITTGVAENRNHGAIKVYPNPCNENCQIDLSFISAGGVILIYDSRGSLMIEEDVTPQSQTHELHLNNSLDPGVYFVRFVEEGGSIYNTKLILGL